MCGIAGLVNFTNGKPLVQHMINRIAHRGPDGQGTFHWSANDNSVDLAHCRLAIIDPRPESDQPFVKNNLIISYNGELYNFKKLRSELKNLGHSFRTESDTEVILEAWRAWDIGCLNKFRGMFAFAILDTNSGRLVLARDHLGIKPLYFAKQGEKLAFASEQKAVILTVPDPQPDFTGIIASMMYYWVPDDISTLSGVEKLAPGHYLEILPNKIRTPCAYWSPLELVNVDNPITDDELFSVLSDSIRNHLVADVPVSSFLSGGLDSSLVTLLAQRDNPDIDAYTIGFRSEDQKLESMPDDLKYARMLAKKNGLKLNEIVIAPDVVNMLPRVVDALDEPIGDPAAINTIMICNAARQAGVKVLLSGMGADELFGGYRKHSACLLANRYRALPAFLRKGFIEPIASKLPVSIMGRGLRTVRWGKRFLNFASLEEEAAFRRSYSLYDNNELKALLPSDLSTRVDELASHHANIYNNTGYEDQVNRMCMTDMKMFMVGLNLNYTDRASMFASTEVRVPFVDIEVAKAAFRLAGNQKIIRGERKAPLKRVAERVLPQSIIYRPKAAFSAPLRAWIQRDLAEKIDDELIGGELVKSGLINKAMLCQMIQSDRSGMEDRSKEIWQLLTLELWMKNLTSQGRIAEDAPRIQQKAS